MATRKTPTPKKKAPAKKKFAASKKAVSKKKTSPRKKSTSRRQPKHAGSTIKKKLLSFLATMGLVAGALFIAFVILHPKNDQKISPPKTVEPRVSQAKKEAPVKENQAKKTAQKKVSQKQDKKPRFEIFPAEPIPPIRPISSSKRVQVTNTRPRVAIIIDDMGYHMKLAEKFLTLDAPLTYAMLPYSKHQDAILSLARKKGAEVMLHLPMEPNEYPNVDPGPGALYTAMNPDERIAELKAVLDSLPDIKGVNNHMGSKMTTMSDQMNQVFTILKKRGLFYVDSRTTAASQCRSSARLFKVPFAERDVFLDHTRTKEAVRSQIDQLINVAEIYGKAVGIGHPHHVTVDVLSEALPRLKKRVKLVFASDIVEVL